MENEITTIYCLCEDLHKAMDIHEDPQVRMSNAEVMTTALTASLFFPENYERSREFLSEHGYVASKKRYFYGLRVHIVITKTGEPVEFILAPGAMNDCRVLKQFDLDLPSGSTIYADKSYYGYDYENLVEEAADINLNPLSKKNSKRPIACWSSFLRKYFRKRVETTARLTLQSLYISQ